MSEFEDIVNLGVTSEATAKVLEALYQQYVGYRDNLKALSVKPNSPLLNRYEWFFAVYDGKELIY